jgi:hypothetical protein
MHADMERFHSQKPRGAAPGSYRVLVSLPTYRRQQPAAPAALTDFTDSDPIRREERPKWLR